MRPPPAARSAYLIVAVLCFGGLCTALVQTLVLPIQGDLPALLATTRSNASWVVTATLLTGAVSMPVAGRLGDIFGKQRVLLASSLVLVLSSLLCAVADSLIPMLLGRGLQGLAMGYIPVAISLVREVTPPRLVGTAIAALSATLGVGGAIGMPLAAWVAQASDWHLLFWAVAVLGVLVMITTATLVPHVRDAHPARFDGVGAIGLGLGLSAILIGVSKGNAWGWSDPRTLGCLVGGLLVLLVWGRHELRHAEPLVDLRVTARRPVLLTNIAAILVGFGMMASAIVVPQLLELPVATGHGMGQTVLQAGLWMAPGGLMMLLMAPVSSRLLSTIGARLTLVLGAGVVGAGYLVALVWMAEPWQLLVALCVSSAGVGIGYAAMPTLILDNVPWEEAGSGVGLNGLMRSVGTTSAGAAMAALLISDTVAFATVRVPTEDAFQLCFLVGAVGALAGGLVALAVPSGRGTPPPERVVGERDRSTVPTRPTR